MILAFLGGAVGPAEMLLVLVGGLLLFGGKRLPDLVRSAGRVAESLRRAVDEVREEILYPSENRWRVRRRAPPAALQPPGQESAHSTKPADGTDPGKEEGADGPAG